MMLLAILGGVTTFIAPLRCFFPSCHSAGYDGKMHCMDLQSGSMHWSCLVSPTHSDTEIKSAPVVANAVAIVGTHGGTVAGGGVFGVKTLYVCFTEFKTKSSPSSVHPCRWFVSMLETPTWQAARCWCKVRRTSMGSESTRRSLRISCDSRSNYAPRRDASKVWDLHHWKLMFEAPKCHIMWTQDD
jgi:hypothetical protein